VAFAFRGRLRLNSGALPTVDLSQSMRKDDNQKDDDCAKETDQGQSGP
jgi:hypothetical protein